MLTVCLGKSTYARCGIIVNATPLEPEWEGHVTLEFSNTTTLPAKIYAGEGVAQMLFFQSDERCETTLQRPRRQVSGPNRCDTATYLGNIDVCKKTIDGKAYAQGLRERLKGEVAGLLTCPVSYPALMWCWSVMILPVMSTLAVKFVKPKKPA